jgi:L-cysteine/cystine lyase
VRERLPALEGVAYLNAGTNGPMPDTAVDAMVAELIEQGRRPRIGPSVMEHWIDLRSRVRTAAASAVCAVPEEIALTSSTSQGIGLVCAGLAWGEGDEVVTTTEEHPGLVGPLHELAVRFGVRVRAVEAGRVEEAISPATRLVAISHVLWTTGRVMPLPEIAAAAHAVGALLLVDGAQSVGNIPVDAAASGADCYAFSGQKWLLGPQGSGALWVSPQALDRVAPGTPWYLTYSEGKVGNYQPDACRLDAGSIDPVTLTGLAAATEFVDGLPGGRPAWLASAAANAQRARVCIEQVEGARAVDPGGPGSGLIAVELAHGEPPDASAALAEQGVLVRHIPETPYLRISVGAWTDEGDIERFCDALGSFLAGAAG